MATQRENLLEVLVRLFAERLLVAARRGLPHRYRRQEKNSPCCGGNWTSVVSCYVTPRVPTGWRAATTSCPWTRR